METVRWRCCSVTRGVSAGAIPKTPAISPVESPQYPPISLHFLTSTRADLLVTARLYHWPCKTNLWQRQRSIYCQARVCKRIVYKYNTVYYIIYWYSYSFLTKKNQTLHGAWCVLSSCFLLVFRSASNIRSPPASHGKNIRMRCQLSFASGARQVAL